MLGRTELDLPERSGLQHGIARFVGGQLDDLPSGAFALSHSSIIWYPGACAAAQSNQMRRRSSAAQRSAQQDDREQADQHQSQRGQGGLSQAFVFGQLVSHHGEGVVVEGAQHECGG
jgi:hypothetical protein